MASFKREIPPCKYGSECYQTKEEHRLKFSHPQDSPGIRKDVKDSEMRGRSPAGPSLETPPEERSSSEHSSEHFTAGQDVGGVLARLNVNAAGIFPRHAAEEFNSSSNKPITAAGAESDGGMSAALQSAPSRKSELSIASSHSGTVLLLLVGLPGSGKSTFCENLVAGASQPWTRVCQDVLKSRKACVKHATRALEENRNVLVDRCNFDVKQRSEFLELAASFGVEAHALVLNLPHSLCVERASKRIGHEGNVEGDGAGRVVGLVSRGRREPSLAEGIHRITFCRTDLNVDKALQEYRGLQPSKPLGPGVFGDVGRASARNPGAGSSNSRSALARANKGLESSMRNKDKNLGQGEWRPKQGFFAGKTGTNAGGTGGVDDQPHRRRIEGDGGARILAFPSISTADFQFDLERASTVIVESVSEFLLASQNSTLKLVLVDLTNSPMLSRVRTKAENLKLDSQRFFTHVGDITKLRSSGGPDCSVIANAANWRLKAGGGGVNAAIYSAAGSDLERATQAVAQTLQPGESILVGLPESSPLFQREGVTHVIHVLGPNMNPQRPNCLSGDYNAGCRILRTAYSSLFKNFSSLGLHSVARSAGEVGVKDQNPSKSSSTDVTNSTNPPRKDAFTVLMQASRRSLDSKSSNTKPSKIRVTEELAARASKAKDTSGYLDHSPVPSVEVRGTGTEYAAVPSLHLSAPGPDVATGGGKGSIVTSEEKNSQLSSGQVGTTSGPDELSAGGNRLREDTVEMERVGSSGTPQHAHQEGVGQIRKSWQPWTLALYKTAVHPEEHTDVVLRTTDDAVAILDAYPKAKQHMLVLARKPGLDGLEDLRSEHLPILKHMHALGEELVPSIMKSDPSLIFRLGYHAVPSMRQLHLHVVSQDFDSARLKNKKHWNSFTTSFFLDSVEVIRQVEERGRVQVAADAAESMLDMELRCHRCKCAHPNLPRLKQHISRCSQPFPRNVHLLTSGGDPASQTM